MASSKSLLGLCLLSIIIIAAVGASASSGGYYSQTCPQAETIIQRTVTNILKRNKNLAGGLLRLHFHDCFVRGCDASILLNSATSTGEKEAQANQGSLRGFAEIDEIKSALEAECPGIVSCADILAVAARDATVKVGGPYWSLALGRKDGFVTSSSEADHSLPTPFMTFDQLVQNFAAVGLNSDEMVTLSGGHTIGRAQCGAVLSRLYDFNGVSGQTDPSLDPKFAEQLKKKCPQNENGSILSMDATKNNFDNLYFKAVLANKGLFTSDANLLNNAVGAELVRRYAQPGSSFSADFAAAMVKMSNIQWASQGQVRTVCSAVKP